MALERESGGERERARRRESPAKSLPETSPRRRFGRKVTLFAPVESTARRESGEATFASSCVVVGREEAEAAVSSPPNPAVSCGVQRWLWFFCAGERGAIHFCV